MTKGEAIKGQFSKAVKRLEEVLDLKETEIVRDSAIQRFEFTFDLSWKLLKVELEEIGVLCASPKGCFKEAYKQGLIKYDDFWLEMVDMRNLVSHTYHQALAEKIYKALPKALKYFKGLVARLGREDE